MLGASSPRSREGSPSASPRAAPPAPLDPHAQREAEKKALQRKLAKIQDQMQRNGKKIEYERTCTRFSNPRNTSDATVCRGLSGSSLA